MAARRTARWLPSLVGIVSLALAFLVLCALVPPAVPMLRLCGVWLAATAAALVSAILAGLLANRTWVSVACLALYPASPARAVLLSAQVVAALPAAVVALWGGDRIAFLISGEGIGIFGVIILAPLVIALACLGPHPLDFFEADHRPGLPVPAPPPLLLASGGKLARALPERRWPNRYSVEADIYGDPRCWYVVDLSRSYPVAWGDGGTLRMSPGRFARARDVACCSTEERARERCGELNAQWRVMRDAKNEGKVV